MTERIDTRDTSPAVAGMDGEQGFRSSLNKLQWDLEWSADEVEGIRKSLDAGEGAAAVQAVHDLLEEVIGHASLRMMRTKRVQHLICTARSYAWKDTDTRRVDACCEQGVEEQASRQYDADCLANYPNTFGRRP